MRDHYRYNEYGKPAPGNTKLSEDGRINLNNAFGYTGEMWDEETNLLYLRARYYEPETGRFLSRDTYEGSLRNPLTKNKYIYVQNSPVNLVDHSGKWAKEVHRGLTEDIIDSFVKSYGGTYFGKFLKENKQKIIDHSNDPDGYFRNFIGGYQWADHFYNPETGKNYKKNDM